MSALKKLQEAKSLKDLAPLIGYKPSSLAFIIRKIPPDKRYYTFEIPKKSGGTRAINAPVAKLKGLQRHLASYLEQCREEIETTGKERNTVSHGYRSGFSIITNARQHRNRRYVLNLDIEGFFPSLNFGRVRGFFIKNEHFKLDKNVATVIAQIACHNNELPQGSPCSPIISDLIGRVLDIRLLQLARRHKCTYSRYVDDLTFSTGKREFPRAIAYQIEGQEAFWAAGNELLKDIAKLGFSINHIKTRMQYRISRQVVTGLTVNRRINIPASYYKAARAMCHSLFSKGTFSTPNPNYKKANAEWDANSLAVIPVEKPPTANQLGGILSYIYHIKNQERLRTQTVEEKRAAAKKTDPKGHIKLYGRFLFYSLFVAPEKPMVICEGKTDRVYLKAAIRKLTARHPKLIIVADGKTQSRVRFFNYKGLAHKILQLTGGGDPIRDFIATYEAATSYYKHAPLSHPVIILVDNDQGADGIFKYLSSKYVAISRTSVANFYHLTKNLYLIKTPEIGAAGTSCIESFFDPALLAEKLEGKSFNPNKDHNSPTEYGKVAFAEKVIVPNAGNIDFSKFSVLIERIISVLDHYNPPA